MKNTGFFSRLTPPDNCGFFKRTQIEDVFSGNVRECFFYEDKGKDHNEEHGKRWRVCFYYASHYAITKFFESAEAKDAFLASLPPITYAEAIASNPSHNRPTP